MGTVSVCMHVCMYMYMYMYMYIYLYMYIYTHMFACIHRLYSVDADFMQTMIRGKRAHGGLFCMYARMYVYVYVCVRLYSVHADFMQTMTH